MNGDFLQLSVYFNVIFDNHTFVQIYLLSFCLFYIPLFVSVCFIL